MSEGVEGVEGVGGVVGVTQVFGSAQATQMAVSVACPVCKTENPPGEQYCVDCGFLLSGAPVETEVVEAEVPGKLIEKLSGREFALKLGENTVGRQSVDILLSDGSVSRKHALVILEGGKCFVEDSGSTNGTFVDANQVASGSRVEAANGAEIKFGACALRVEMAESVGGVEGEGGAEGVEGAEAVAEAEPAAEPEAEVESPVAVAKLVGIDETVGEYGIVAGANTIGRRSENAIMISGDAYVSGNHAVIEASDEGVKVTDVGSTNGTMVNENKLTPNLQVELKAGDVVTFGRSKFRVEIGSRESGAGESDVSDMPDISDESEDACEGSGS